MSAKIFDGRSFAAKMEEDLSSRVRILKEQGINPHLSTIYVSFERMTRGRTPTDIYIDLKHKAAERIGITFETYKIGYKRDLDYTIKIMKVIEMEAHGMFVQLPLPQHFLKNKQRMIDAIPLDMDVDGMREGSPYKPATVKAVLKILEAAEVAEHASVAVFGSEGEVGRKLIPELSGLGYEVLPLEIGDRLPSASKCDVIVTATGKAEMIKPNYVKPGAVLIDVGSPKSEVDHRVFEQNLPGFVTPVPGGVGPVTVACLMENLIEACEKKLQATKAN